MTTYDMLKGIKDSIYLPTRTKAVFSLESEGFLFDKTKRNLSEKGSQGLSPLLPARRRNAAATAPGRRPVS